jgi:hypothetical protein
LQEVEYVTSLTMTEFSRMSDRVEGFPSWRNQGFLALGSERL